MSAVAQLRPSVPEIVQKPITRSQRMWLAIVARVTSILLSRSSAIRETAYTRAYAMHMAFIRREAQKIAHEESLNESVSVKRRAAIVERIIGGISKTTTHKLKPSELGWERHESAARYHRACLYQGGSWSRRVKM